MPFKSSRPRPSCPFCGSSQVVPIVYGLPTPEAFDEADRGEIILGGCCISPQSPTCSCRVCNGQWRAGGHDLADSDGPCRPAPGLDLRIRLRSAILGHLVGDAFGVPYEFMSPSTLPAELTWRGFGTHNQPPGTWSDDGALMLCQLASLVECGKFDPADTGQRFLKWLDTGYMAAGNEVFDVGQTTMTALGRLGRGIPPLDAGPTSEECNGNGSLMRVLPLALWGHHLPTADLLALLHDGSRLTHGHALAQVCCGVYGLLLREILRGSGGPEAWTAAIQTAEAAYAGDRRFGPEHRTALAQIREFKRCRGSGYVLDCLCSAWSAAKSSNSVEEAVVSAVRYGHDTDTTAAVAGSLAGAAHGLEGAATLWATQLRGFDQHEMIDEFTAAVLRNCGCAHGDDSPYGQHLRALQTPTPYSAFEHRHRFAAWAAARAAQRGYAGVRILVEALEACGVVEYVRAYAGEEVTSTRFDELHRGWCRVVVAKLQERKVSKTTFGRAAKLIAVYLKAMIVVGPEHESPLARVAHPPIDRLLLQNICRAPEVFVKARDSWKAVNWTQLDEDAYTQLISELRECVPPDEPLWWLERYWSVSEEM